MARAIWVQNVLVRLHNRTACQIWVCPHETDDSPVRTLRMNQAKLQKITKWDSLDHKAVTTKVKKHDFQWAHFLVRILGRKQASTLWSSSVKNLAMAEEWRLHAAMRLASPKPAMWLCSHMGCQ